MIVKLLTEHHLEFLRSKEDCRGSSESTLVKLLESSIIIVSRAGMVPLIEMVNWFSSRCVLQALQI